MNRRQFPQAADFPGGDHRVTLPIRKSRPNLGPAHFNQVAQPIAVSRRSFFGTVAGAALVFAPGFVVPSAAQDVSPGALPKPIPGGVAPGGPGTTVFHFNFPSPTSDLSSITDFNGKIGVANLGGTGTGTNTSTGETLKLVYDVDVRFMQGEYIGTDGKDHFGTFGFI